MRMLDRALRDWRVAVAVAEIPPGARVLDVGCHDGALFRAIGPGLREGLGLDPALVGVLEGERYRLLPGRFPDDVPDDAGPFDAITMLALFEHIPPEDQPGVVEACAKLLVSGGLVVLTVPSPAVDPVLDALVKVGLADGMAHEEHYGFRTESLVPLFRDGGFEVVSTRRFQLGMNNAFVFRAP